jgi:hypothetical protein
MDTIAERIASEAHQKGDSPEHATERFFSSLKELFKMLSEINNFVAAETGEAPPIAPILITGLLTLLEPLKARPNVVMEPFWDRASEHIEFVAARDVAKLVEVAGELFPEVPSLIMDRVKNLIANDNVPPESMSDVFDFVFSLLKIAVKHRAMTLPSDSERIEKVAIAVGMV